MREGMVGRACVASLLTLAVACSRSGPSAPVGPGPVEVDTIRGTVQVNDTAAAAPINLVPSSPDGATYGTPISLVSSPALRSVNGLRIQIVGTQAHDRRWPDRVTVVSFTVIGTRPEPAIDGMLVEDSGVLYIATVDGVRHTLTDPPPGLRAHVGRRVWVAGPLDREPLAYGVIDSAR